MARNYNLDINGTPLQYQGRAQEGLHEDEITKAFYAIADNVARQKLGRVLSEDELKDLGDAVGGATALNKRIWSSTDPTQGLQGLVGDISKHLDTIANKNKPPETGVGQTFQDKIDQLISANQAKYSNSLIPLKIQARGNLAQRGVYRSGLADYTLGQLGRQEAQGYSDIQSGGLQGVLDRLNRNQDSANTYDVSSRLAEQGFGYNRKLKNMDYAQQDKYMQQLADMADEERKKQQPWDIANLFLKGTDTAVGGVRAYKGI